MQLIKKRLDNLGKVIDIQNRMLSYSLNIDKEELTKVIDEYTRALDLLDSYDHQTNYKLATVKKETGKCLFFASGASDGNRTRIISLEG